MNLPGRNLKVVLCLALALFTGLCYLPVTSHDFISIDDHQYITENPHVAGGLTSQNIIWAFRSGYACNWHPLTWISHMLDCQLFGLHAGGHHFTNLLFHTCNTVLVFLLFSSMTRQIWPSAFLAAFFGWHPLHVESVAWVSERKDVLSAFFWLLSLMGYQRYCQLVNGRYKHQSDSAAGRRLAKSGWYLITLFLFALGLMSKPMVVTLPFVMLLLDFWPLRRITLAEMAEGPNTVTRLVMEKIPFFTLSFISCAITYYVQDQGGATSSLNDLPLPVRLGNSIVAYATYVGKTLWPTRLTVLYPLRLNLAHIEIAAAALFVLATTFICLKRARTLPFLAVGWLWFVGTLVPVIGLVQVGSQAMADRYTYLPSLGLFVILIWGSLAVVEKFAQINWLPGSSGLAALAICLALTSIQLRYWQNSLRLAIHGVEVAPESYLACNALGKALDDLGRRDDAFEWFAKSVGLQPNYSEGQCNVATILFERGRIEDAQLHFKLALQADPRSANAIHGLGNSLFRLGRLDEASTNLSRLVGLQPESAEAHQDFGVVLLHQGKLAEAARELSAAVQIDPNHLEARRNFGVALAQQGKVAEALPHLKRAAKLAPADPEMRFNYGLALAQAGQWKAAETEFTSGFRLRPQESRFHYRLAVTYSHQHKYAEAIEQYRETIRLAPEFPEGLSELAWILSTCPNGDLRSGKTATSLAEKACELTAHKNPEMLSTLAAAYAESGRFPEAIDTARIASQLAREKGQAEFVSKSDQWLAGYEAGKPARESL